MKALVAITVCFLLASCANNLPNGLFSSQVEQGPRSLHYYVEQLTRQLLLTSPSVELNQSVAVGTILPLTQLSGNNNPPNNLIGQQLQESLVTLATQAGLNVIEFKTMNSIKVESSQDLMLSRQLDEINTQLSADYFLTGTYHNQRQTLVVNVRLIDVTTHNVIAAATDTIPIGMMWTDAITQSSTQTNRQNNHYRGLN